MLKQSIRKLIDEIAETINPQTVVQYAQTLASIEQRTDSESFAAAHKWLTQQYQDVGLDTCSIDMTCDGTTKIQSYQAPIAWTCKQAIGQIKIDENNYKVVADRSTEPYTAILGTGHTGPQGVEGALLHITSKDELINTDCSGKIILVGKIPPTAIRALAIEKQALGVVSYYTEKPDINHQHVRWFNSWDSNADGWLPTKEAADQNLPGISISPDLGSELIALTEHQTVVFKLIIEGSYDIQDMPSVLARTGATASKQSAIITAHMYEPGLLDNASGVATALTTAKLLNNPSFKKHHKRELQFFHGQECYSVMDLANKQSLPDGILGHLNIDTVGDSTRPMYITDGLQATDNFSGPLIEFILGEAIDYYDDVAAENDEFEINCTLLADPLITGISTRGIGQGKCNSWHTSADRPEHVTMDEKKVNVALLTAATWAQFIAVADIHHCNGILEQLEQDFVKKLPQSANTTALLNHYIALVQSTQLLIDENDLESYSSTMNAHIINMKNAEQHQHYVDLDESDPALIEQSASTYPKALVGGPASSTDFAPEDLKAVGGPKWNTNHIIYKSLADGTTSVLDIAKKVNAFRPRGKSITIKYLMKFYQAYSNSHLIQISA